MQCFSETGKGKERGVGGLNSNDSNCRARKQFPYHNPADNMVASVRNDDSIQSLNGLSDQMIIQNHA